MSEPETLTVRGARQSINADFKHILKLQREASRQPSIVLINTFKTAMAAAEAANEDRSNMDFAIDSDIKIIQKLRNR